MDIVKIQCPNCGAELEKSENDYFGNCPYCGGEIGFNEITDEAEVRRIHDEYEQAMSQQNNSTRNYEEYQKKLKKWNKMRNILLGAIFIVTFIACLISDEAGKSVTGFVVFISLLLPLFMAFAYPYRGEYSSKYLKSQGSLQVFAQFLLNIVIFFVLIYAAWILGFFLAAVLTGTAF